MHFDCWIAALGLDSVTLSEDICGERAGTVVCGRARMRGWQATYGGRWLSSRLLTHWLRTGALRYRRRERINRGT